MKAVWGRAMRPSSTIRSTREQITDRLRDEVFSGQLAVGERVSEVSLAERFGVSRGPIREALSQMVSEGLFLARPNCGVVVAPPAPPEVLELILPIRRTLETHALRQIFPRLTTDDFHEWDELLHRMERVCRQGQAEAWPQLDISLHRSLMEKCSQPDLLAIWQAVITRMRAHFGQRTDRSRRSGGMLPLYRDHAALIDTFRSGDLDTAVRALEAHIDDN
jgi:DNA-binding GntR family transcriptional regulator